MTGTQLLNLGSWSAQVGVLALAAALLARLVNVDSATVRYAWWRSVLIVCLALPVIQPWQPTKLASLIPPPPLTAPASVARESNGSLTTMVTGVRARPVSATSIVALALVAGSLLRLAWLAGGLMRLRRIRRTASAGDPVHQDRLQPLIDAGADVRYAAVGQPVTFGIRRPIVLLPQALRSMPAGVQHAVLTHELWHVRRRDWLWTLGEEMLRSVLWFHPAIWYLISSVQQSREQVVDELSVLTTNAKRSYLEALLAFAEEPAIYPAAPFIRRRQLFNRMMLISREGVMSSRKIVVSSAAMVGALVITGWYGALAFPLTANPVAGPADQQSQAQPRDPRPGTPGPATAREAEFKLAVAANPTDVKSWLALAKLQEERGANAEAEATYQSARTATSGNHEVLLAAARFFTRNGEFDKGVAALEDASAQNPGDPAGHQIVATYYWEKAQKDQSLTPADKLMYIESGIRATDRAIAQKADYLEALTYKNIMLRMKANLTTDAAEKQELVAEADKLRNRAIELSKARSAAGEQQVPLGAPPPPPPPPPPQYYEVDGQQAVRIGGDIPTPTKIKDVRPVFPESALNEGVSGIVILEVVLDKQGDIHAARIVRSNPHFDDAALVAVKQWKFAPTVRDGIAIPVAMTVTVNFTAQ